VAVVQEAIEDGGGDHLVAEDLALGIISTTREE
jgi:hypothetical protein